MKNLAILVSIILTMAVIGAGIVFLPSIYTQPEEQIGVIQSVAVKTHKVETRDITEWLFAEGIAQAVRKEFLTFEQPGTVAQIGTDQNGEELREGSKITGPQAGEIHGQPIARLENRESNAVYDAAQAAFDQAKDMYERSLKMHNEDVASRQEVEQATAAFKTAKAELDAAKARLDKTALFAPFDGVITLMNIKDGSFVTGGIMDGSQSGQESSAAVVVIDDSLFEVVVHLPAHQAGIVQRGQDALIAMNGAEMSDHLKGGDAIVIKAKVWSVSPSVNLQKRSVLVRLRTDGPISNDFRLKDGMFVTAWIAAKNVSGALSIPYTALIQRGDESFTFVLNPESQNVYKLPIKTGLYGNEYIEVTDGLKTGYQVIVEGEHLLTEGAKVRIIETPGADGHAE